MSEQERRQIEQEQYDEHIREQTAGLDGEGI